MFLDGHTEVYVRTVVDRLRMRLGGELVGVCLLGSGATGGFDAARSDVDLAAVCRRPLGPEDRRSVLAALAGDALPCPACGLDLALFSLGEVVRAHRAPLPEIDLGPEGRRPRALDLAMARECGRPLVGPPPDELFAPIPRAWQLDLAAEALRRRAASGLPRASTLLVACRAWRYACEYRWSSLEEAARWARFRGADPESVDLALAARDGVEGCAPAREDVERVLARAHAALERASAAMRREASV